MSRSVVLSPKEGSAGARSHNAVHGFSRLVDLNNTYDDMERSAPELMRMRLSRPRLPIESVSSGQEYTDTAANWQGR